MPRGLLDLLSFDDFSVPFVAGANTCRDALKLERRAFVSSVLDFSEVGRRMIEGPPLMILLFGGFN